MLGGDIQDARRDGQDVEHAGLSQRGVDGLGRSVFGDDEPAARGLRAALVQIDGGGVVGQVGIVDAVAAHALALGPLAAQAGVLAQAVGELLGLGDEHGQRLAVTQVECGGGFGHGGRGAALIGDVAGICGLAHGIRAGRGFKCRRSTTERGPDLDSGLLVVGHDGDGALGLGVERAGHKAIAGERGDRCRSKLGRTTQLADQRHGVVHERQLRLGSVRDDGGAGDSARMIQHGGGLGGTKIDKALVAGALDHALGGLAGGGVNVHGNDARLALTCGGLALARLGKQLLPQSGVMQLPALKAPTLTGGARGAVGQDIHGLQQQAAAGARGVDQCGQGLVFVIVSRQLALAQRGPANLCQHQRGVVGAQYVRALAGAGCGGRQALEQRVARKVQADARTALTQRKQQVNVGVGGVDVGAAARGLGQAVAQRVLGAQGREARVAQLLGHAAGGDGDGGARADDALPGDVVHAVVQLVGILRLKAPEHYEHAAGQARPQACAVALFELALKRSAALQAADMRKPEAFKLIGECGLKALGAACVKFHG